MPETTDPPDTERRYVFTRAELVALGIKFCSRCDKPFNPSTLREMCRECNTAWWALRPDSSLGR